MFYIAICDDEKIICEQIAKMIKQYSESRQKDIAIKMYENGEDLYEDLEKGSCIDLIFLDIELYKFNGVEIGNLIRTTLDNHFVKIVYISAKEEYAMDLFVVHPLNFLIKPIESIKIDNCIDLAMKMGENTPEYFSYQVNETTKKVPLSDILYLESCARKIKLYSVTGETAFYGNLENIHSEIKEYGFLYIHKSYIVNYLRVKTNTANEMVLENGITLPISRSKRKGVSEELLKMKTKGVIKWN